MDQKKAAFRYEKVMTKHSLFINGRWAPADGSLFASYNSATGELVWEGRSAKNAQVQEAVDAAKRAFSSWKLLPFTERASFCHRFVIELAKIQTELAECISQEVGKPLWESRQEVQTIKDKIDISIRAYQERTCLKKESSGDVTLYTRHMPHGVVAVIGPFNFPGHLPNGHIVPALLAGNTVLFKPSEKTPKTAQLLVQCWDKAKLPEGVLNLLQGAKEVAQNIVENPDVKGIFFTGSYTAGCEIQQASKAMHDRIVALEMGGNNPLVVGAIENIQAALYMIIQSAFLTSGQRCTSSRRLILVENEKTQSLLEQLVRVTRKLEIGYYSDFPEPYMGPLISSTSANGLIAFQIKCISLGGRILHEVKAKNALVSCGIIDMTGCTLVDEEIFGPFLQVIRVSTLDEAIDIANNTEYGLSASILTENPDEYVKFLQSIRCGIVNWNMPTTGAKSSAPFGGIGKSGNFHPSGYYAADYASYPVASLEQKKLTLPTSLPSGMHL